jgi:hypothetical protein
VKTPGHAVLNLLLLSSAGHAPAVVAGAVAPDAPIALLYLFERHVRGTPEERIWSSAYQRPAWQAVIHGSHSIPLAVAAVGVSLLFRAPWATAFFLSALLHAFADLPVHAEDAHRHFVPLSNWRFVSPLSYWDVRHHARVVAAVEAALVWVVGALLWTDLGAFGRVAVPLVAVWYAYGYWRTFVRNDGRWQTYF